MRDSDSAEAETADLDLTLTLPQLYAAGLSLLGLSDRSRTLHTLIPQPWSPLLRAGSRVISSMYSCYKRVLLSGLNGLSSGDKAWLAWVRLEGADS